MSSALQPYINMIEFISQVSGPGCRVVLYDLSHGVGAARAAALAGYSNTELAVGSPLTDVAKKIVAEEKWKSSDYTENFRNDTRDGRILCSSNYFIKKNDKLVGMICVNRDVTKYNEIGREIFRLTGLSTEEFSASETRHDIGAPYAEKVSGTDEIIDEVVRARFKGAQQPEPARMTQRERLDIIAALDARGAFLVRGTVSASAARLGCSEASIYRYIAKLKK